MPLYHIASETAAERVCAYVRAQAKAGKPVVVSVQEPRRLRSLAANGRHWVLMTLISEHVRPAGEGYSKEAWHEYFRQRFLDPTERKLPNGKVIREWPSTSDMSAEDFRDFTTLCEVWANERGVVMPDQE